MLEELQALTRFPPRLPPTSASQFCKTERFLSLMRSAQSSYADWPEDGSSTGTASAGGGAVSSSPAAAARLVTHDDEAAHRAAKTYLTISQAANEKAVAAAKTSIASQ